VKPLAHCFHWNDGRKTADSAATTGGESTRGQGERQKELVAKPLVKREDRMGMDEVKAASMENQTEIVRN